MTLIKCKECGEEVSTKAAACPKCGAASPKKTTTLTMIIAIVFGIGIVATIVGGITQPEKIKLPPTPEQIAEKKTDDFYIGLAVVAVRSLKQSMKDPESFEIKSVDYNVNHSTCFTYRAKNSFNATLQNHAVLAVAEKNSKLYIEGVDGQKFYSSWNKYCANAPTKKTITEVVKSVI